MHYYCDWRRLLDRRFFHARDIGRQGAEPVYRAKKVAMMTIKPTSILGEASELAPFDTAEVAAAAAPEASDTAEDVSDETADEVDDGALAALSAAEMSLGNMRGVVATLLRSIEPSAPTMSEFMAMRLRVKRIFSAANEWAQSGKPAKSIEPPQV